MAKGIRSKVMKKHRSLMRKTVGEAQTQKHLRKALRRLAKTVDDQDAPADGAAPGMTLAAIKAALTGGVAVPVKASSGTIRTVSGPPRTKKLRYTFNSTLRDTRLADDLEDLTDDEDEVRLADKRYQSGGSTAAAGAGAVEGEDEEAMGEEKVEMSGVKKGADKPVPKRENGNKLADNYRDGCPGMYDTDPLLVNPKKERSHRKGKLRNEGGKAAYQFWS